MLQQGDTAQFKNVGLAICTVGKGLANLTAHSKSSHWCASAQWAPCKRGALACSLEHPQPTLTAPTANPHRPHSQPSPPSATLTNNHKWGPVGRVRIAPTGRDQSCHRPPSPRPIVLICILSLTASLNSRDSICLGITTLARIAKCVRAHRYLTCSRKSVAQTQGARQMRATSLRLTTDYMVRTFGNENTRDGVSDVVDQLRSVSLQD